MSEQITCPSGLACTVRGLKTKEADILASSQGAKQMPATLNKILTACVESIEDTGPYKAPINWDAVLAGDRIYLLLMIRKATLGPKYLFKAQCGGSSCNNRFEWEVDLNDLPIIQFTPEQRAAFVSGNRFETTLDDGTAVFFRLPTGADEKKAIALKAQHKDSLVTLALRMRIAEIDGVASQDMRKFVENMGLGEANNLIEKFDEVDCGVETTIEIECPECYSESDVTLPFDRAFFFPSQQSRQRKRRTISVEA